MPIGIDDLDFYEEEPKLQEPPVSEPPANEPPANEEKPGGQKPEDNIPPQGGAQEPPQNEEGKDDIITTLLKEKGISDPSKIKFEGDNDEVEERDWKDLSREEQLNILRPTNTAPAQDNDLSDEEIEFLNALRMRNLTPTQYLQQLQDSYNAQIEPSYTVDELSDDDLFILDLQARVEGITEEQLAKSLETAKQDEDLFKKQMEGIRKEYKDLEDQKNQQNELLLQQQQEEQYQNFSNIINEQIDNLTSIGGLDVELEKDDKEQLAEFILGRDEAGVSNLGKVLNDPESLVLMAWYALNGEQMIDDITTIYQNQLKKAKQDAYNKGLEDGKKGVQPGHVVVTPPPSNKPEEKNGNISSIEDLDF